MLLIVWVQVRLAKERKKGDKIVSDSQERAFWRVYRPPPGCLSSLEVVPVPSRFRPGLPRPPSRKRTLTDLQREVSVDCPRRSWCLSRFWFYFISFDFNSINFTHNFYRDQEMLLKICVNILIIIYADTYNILHSRSITRLNFLNSPFIFCILFLVR